MKKTAKSSLREQAETVLSSKPKGKSTNARPQEHLIHELQVHQIELEIQNEELRRTQARLEEVSSKYFDLYQSAPSGYFIFDEDWTILEANLTGARMLGTAQQKIIKTPLHDFIYPEFQDTFYLYSRKVPQSRHPETCELKLKNYMYISLESIAVLNEKGEKTGKIRSLFSDITERKIIEEAFIQELELKVAERTKELQAANKSLGKEIAERMVAEEGLQKAMDTLEDKVRERTALLLETNKSLLVEIERRKRSERRLRTAQKNLRAMASEVFHADERARQHFAQNLHDIVVQTLGAAKMRSELLREHIPGKDSQYFQELQNMLSHSISEARMLMTEMSPPVLYELGLIPAMESLADEIRSNNDLKIELESSNGLEHLTHEAQVILFQAVCELLKNVVIHAEAKHAVVSIAKIREEVQLCVEDDGKGFDGNVSFRADKSAGFGLFSIRERLKHLGGQLVIKSKPGRTRVVVSVPKTLGQ